MELPFTQLELYEIIKEYLKSGEVRATLIGRAYDIGEPESIRACAEDTARLVTAALMWKERQDNPIITIGADPENLTCPRCGNRLGDCTCIAYKAYHSVSDDGNTLTHFVNRFRNVK